MGIFGKSKKSSKKNPDVITEPVDPGWIRSARGNFLNLLSMDPEEAGLSGKGGVYLVWHGGVRPEWLYVGHSNDLAKSLHEAGNNKEIGSFQEMGGLFVSWAFVLDDYRPGVVRFLQENLPTIIPTANTYDDDTMPVPVFSPGKEPKAGGAKNAPGQPE